jgi:hypothetical protein
VVWLYAAIRPRFGAGPATAVRAGLAFWIVAGPVVVLFNLVQAASFRPALVGGGVILSMLVSAVLFALAGLAGAWQYREAGDAQLAPAPAAPAGGPM